jgi:hypothetical protein
MRISRLLALVVALWLMSCHCVEAGETTPEGSAQSVLLRFRPKVNSIVKHKITLSGRMEMTTAMLPEPMRVQLTMAMMSREKVLGETPEGLKIQTTTSEGKVKMVMEGMGESDAQSQKIPDSKVVMVMDDRGRVKEVVSTDIPGAGEQMPLSNETLASLGGMAGFPEGNLKVNDTWTSEVKLPTAEGMPEINLSMNSRLLELLTYQERKCAKIRTAFSGPLSFDLSQVAGAPAGAAGTMEATVQGTFTQYYDHENSVWLDGEGQMTMNMTMNVSAEGVDTGAMTTKMVMNMKMQLVK